MAQMAFTIAWFLVPTVEQEAAKKQCSAVYVFSAKGAAFNGQPGAAPQDSWPPRHER